MQAVLLGKTAGGEEAPFADSPSKQLLWDFSKIARGDREREITSKWLILSADRKFDPAASEATWDDIGKLKMPLHELKKVTAVSGPVHARIQREAERIKDEHAPAQAVMAFCIWVNGFMRYEENVSFSPTDVETIMKANKGHCGHYSVLVSEFCRAVGIPYRSVWGLNLYSRDGRSSLNSTRDDFTNIHTWGEFYLPDVGWIELEPSQGKRAFEIPSQFVQNNFGFQNYRVTRDAKSDLEDVAWIWNGGWASDFVETHKITFKTLNRTLFDRRMAELAKPEEKKGEGDEMLEFGQERAWTNYEGRKIQARVVGFEWPDVVFTINGKRTLYPVHKLSREDQDLLLELKKRK